ncbi:hypothetical protein [Desulfosarcina sp.]|uniref:hypothetical protein n=1 Tax=Desulfosarcina sp. TaxID=2027861 RepID=UPI003562EEE1
MQPDKQALCTEIRELYPDIGECEIDVQAEYDEDQKTWVVHLKKGNHDLKTYLDDGDAETCMIGIKGVGLSIQVSQLMGDIERIPKDP